MKEKYKIITEFAKDISCETPDVETYLETKENIQKYKLAIDISSKPIKNEIVEINLVLKFQQNNLEKKRSNFEIACAVIVKVDKNITDKKEVEKIVLVNIPNEVFPRLEDLFTSLVKKSGFSNIKVEKNVDFEKLYNERFS